MRMNSQAEHSQQPKCLDLDLGVIVETRAGVTKWQKTVVIPHSVFLSPKGQGFKTKIIYSQGQARRYLAGTLTLTLHRKETNDYQVNLQSRQPRVFVGLRDCGDGSEMAWMPFLITVSPYEAEGYMHGDDGIMEGVAMPEELIEAVASFIETHHKSEPFKKRRRTKYFDKDETPFARPPGWRETDQ